MYESFFNEYQLVVCGLSTASRTVQSGTRLDSKIVRIKYCAFTTFKATEKTNTQDSYNHH